MSRIINSGEEVVFATEEECLERRESLISAGIITPANKNDIILSKDGNIVVSTKESCAIERKKLIDVGLINIDLCNLLPEKNRPVCAAEEGEYKSRPIKTDCEYERRKAAYFRMMQEILYSRKDLNLILAKKEDTDPDWYF